MKALIKTSMGLVAVAAFALSFQSLMELGQFAGYARRSWLYPVVVDLGTVSSCTAWLATRSRQAFWMAWALLSISVVQNGTVHWLIATGQRPEWWLATLVATVPPMVLGLTVHLAVDGRSPGQRAGKTPAGTATFEDVTGGASDITSDTDRPGQRHRHVPPAEPTTSGSAARGAAKDTPEDELAATLVAQGAGRRKVAAELDISEHAARKLLAERRNGNSHVQA